MKTISTLLFICALNTLNAQVVSTLAGDSISGDLDATGTAARFQSPRGITYDASGKIYFADIDNHKIKMIIVSTGVVTTFAGTGQPGAANGNALTATFNRPQSMCLDASGNMYVAEFAGAAVRKISTDGVVSTLAGTNIAGYIDGSATVARFAGLTDIVADANGNVFVSDYNNNCIRKITSAGVVSTFAGSSTGGYADGTGGAAKFNLPHGLAIDGNGNLYVADRVNYLIRKITPAGVVSTLAGSGISGTADGALLSATFNGPLDVDVDANGNVYVADGNSNLIRKISPSTGSVTTIAGAGTSGFLDGPAAGAQFNFPTGVCAGANGVVYITDYNNFRVRKYDPTAIPTALTKHQSANEISVFPNPAKNVIQFKQTPTITFESLTIYDATGKEVLRHSAFNQQSLDISTLESGLYYLKISAEGKNLSGKFIKE